jgi:hypothetical protein
MTALQEHEAESTEELRDLELRRLDALQVAHWDRAMEGDSRATEIVLKVMARRARLLGRDRFGDAAQPRMLVTGPTTS